MSDQLHIFPAPIQPVSPPVAPGGHKGSPGQGPSFQSLLEGKLGGQPLRFSQHAQSRMDSRGIRLAPEQLARVEQAVARLDAKGGRDSLVLIDQTAMVVSIKNHTVVTVVDPNSLQDNVFTNIDSAIIA
jgi:flagellar operon protein